MDFTQKYQLIELLPGEGVESYRARQTNTGRDVTVHLLVGGRNFANEAFLSRLRGMHPTSMAKLIEVGEHEGNTFVVTVAPPYMRLAEWLAEQDKAAAAAREFGKAGFWKRPDAAAVAPPVKAPASPSPLPVAGKNEPGEFTRQFQSPTLPSPEPGLPMASSPLTGQFRTGAPPVPDDEFDKLFGAASQPDPVPNAPAAPPAPPPAASAPGTFTQMFQNPMGAGEPT